KRRLTLGGEVRLLSYYPQDVDIKISGALPGEILQDLSDIHLTEAKGRGDISVKISGDFFSPLITGTFVPVNIIIRPRGVYKDIEITAGKIDFSNGNLYLRDIKAQYDGSILDVDGYFVLMKNFYCNLILKGANIPFRKPEQYNGEVSPTVTLKGRKNNLTLSGKLDIITGKYTRKFDIIQEIITIHRFREGTDPLWKHYPWVGAIKLDLSLLNSGDFEVENNIGELSLDGLLALKGTLAKPKLKGSVNVNFGNFKIPFLKGQYEVSRGTVDFDKGKQPFLQLEGTTTVENNFGEEVIVSLNLLGPLNKITFSLKSFPELDQGQILMLLASGRTTAELRRMYHGDPRSGTGSGTTTYNPVQLYDEPIKQITGDFFSQLVSNPIKMITKLDLIRFELGSDSFQLKISKKFIKRIKFTGEFEVGFMGQNRQEGGLEIKFHDRLMLDSKLRRYEPGINEYIYETPFKGKVELKYKISLRGSFRDILGF
ncbi:translocation/assembly module TamB, partial [Myxococcota bacterium]|nr:translocation/assembly module TamB [Myxococcota bacterium]